MRFRNALFLAATLAITAIATPSAAAVEVTQVAINDSAVTPDATQAFVGVAVVALTFDVDVGSGGPNVTDAIDEADLQVRDSADQPVPFNASLTYDDASRTATWTVGGIGPGTFRFVIAADAVEVDGETLSADLTQPFRQLAVLSINGTDLGFDTAPTFDPITEVVIAFDVDVGEGALNVTDPLTENDLQIVTGTGDSELFPVADSFEYDSATRTATWTFSGPFSATPSGGGDAIELEPGLYNIGVAAPSVEIDGVALPTDVNGLFAVALLDDLRVDAAFINAQVAVDLDAETPLRFGGPIESLVLDLNAGVFFDIQGVGTEILDANDLTVTGPSGAAVVIDDISVQTDGLRNQITFSFPSGATDFAALGTYTFTVPASGVAFRGTSFADGEDVTLEVEIIEGAEVVRILLNGTEVFPADTFAAVSNLDTLAVAFNVDVSDANANVSDPIEAGDLFFGGAIEGDVLAFSPSDDDVSFNYDPGTFIATWTFERPLRLVAEDDLVNLPGNVYAVGVDDNQVVLGNVSLLDANRLIAVSILPGDDDADGDTDALDAFALRQALAAEPPSADQLQRFDFDDDGEIDSDDAATASTNRLRNNRDAVGATQSIIDADADP